MDGDDERRRSVVTGSNPPLTNPAERARQEVANGLRLYDRLNELISAGIAETEFRLRPSTLMELNRLTVEDLVQNPGRFRQAPITIPRSAHHPPNGNDTPLHTEEMCEYVNKTWAEASAVHLAAYVLWRVNWIQPFEDGNGRTARATAYLVLCTKLGHAIAGVPTFPDRITQNRGRYYEALRAADMAAARSRTDVSKLATFIQDLVVAQLQDAVTGENGSQGRISLPASSSSSTPPSAPRGVSTLDAKAERWRHRTAVISCGRYGPLGRGVHCLQDFCRERDFGS